MIFEDLRKRLYSSVMPANDQSGTPDPDQNEPQNSRDPRDPKKKDKTLGDTLSQALQSRNNRVRF